MINILTVRQSLYTLVVFLLLSCNMKTYKLLNKRTKVPVDATAYNNKSKFNSLLLNNVDTSVIYEEFDTRYNILKRLDNHIESSIYNVYKFYPNGCINNFYLDRRNEPIPINELNPLFTGYRGVYYSENNKIRYDLFAEIDQRQHTGKITGTLTFSGDTLYVKRDDRKGLNATDYSTEIYIKRKLPPEYFVYKADW